MRWIRFNDELPPEGEEVLIGHADPSWGGWAEYIVAKRSANRLIFEDAPDEIISSMSEHWWWATIEPLPTS